MYRRRRPPRGEVAFSFDSFLDLVANVCGIIIRLILVAWVGARTYHSAMEGTTPATAPATAAAAAADPLSPELAKTKSEIDKARAKLLEELHELRLVQVKSEQSGRLLEDLSSQQQETSRQQQALDQAMADKGLVGVERPQPAPALSLADLKKRQEEFVRQIKELQQLPASKKILRFRTPVSQPVRIDELFFECQAGRVSFIDLQAFKLEVEHQARDLMRQMEKDGRAMTVAGPIGPFRMHFAIQAPRLFSNLDLVQHWGLEPILPVRGETFEQAIKPGSAFRQIADTALPDHTVVTFCVYPESFGLFRQLRDFLCDRGLEVAARPLPDGVPIRWGSDGSASRGQ